jgi:hypothetical protein
MCAHPPCRQRGFRPGDLAYARFPDTSKGSYSSPPCKVRQFFQLVSTNHVRRFRSRYLSVSRAAREPAQYSVLPPVSCRKTRDLSAKSSQKTASGRVLTWANGLDTIPVLAGMKVMVKVAQSVRAPDCGSGGRGFESRLSPFWRTRSRPASERRTRREHREIRTVM